ncbi:MAG: DUF4831 family protein [Acidobacteria bacterium]|nr:DUF4831 family protein [Acidobacteriota bacterium]
MKAYDQYLIWLAARTRVVTGATSPGIPVGDSLQQMLKEIDGQIKLYKELFFGTATKEVWNAHFAVTPDKNDWDKPFQLFEFTSEKGVCLSPDLQSPCAAQPNDSKVSFLDAGVPKKFQGVQACPCKGEMVALKLQRDDQQLATQISKNAENPDGERGFYYRVPAFSTANILKGTKPILRNKLVIAQFGPTFSLPSSTGGRKTSYDIELYATGALKNFKLGSEGLLTSATVKDLGSAAGTVLDARAQAAQAAAASDFNQVKRMRELLEECQKIKNAQVGLSLPVNLPAYCPQ